MVGFKYSDLARVRPRGEQNAEAARILSEELQRRFNEEAVGARRQLRAVLFVMEHALRSALSQATVPKELLQELDALGSNAQNWSNLVSRVLGARHHGRTQPPKSKELPHLWQYLGRALELLPSDLDLAELAKDMIVANGSDDSVALLRQVEPQGKGLSMVRESAAKMVGVAWALLVRRDPVPLLALATGATKEEAALAAVHAGFRGVAAGWSCGFELPVAAGGGGAFVLRAKGSGNLGDYTTVEALFAQVVQRHADAKAAREAAAAAAEAAEEDASAPATLGAEPSTKKAKSRKPRKPRKPHHGTVVVLDGPWTGHEPAAVLVRLLLHWFFKGRTGVRVVLVAVAADSPFVLGLNGRGFNVHRLTGADLGINTVLGAGDEAADALVAAYLKVAAKWDRAGFDKFAFGPRGAALIMACGAEAVSRAAERKELQMRPASEPVARIVPANEEGAQQVQPLPKAMDLTKAWPASTRTGELCCPPDLTPTDVLAHITSDPEAYVRTFVAALPGLAAVRSADDLARWLDMAPPLAFQSDLLSDCPIRALFVGQSGPKE